MSVVKTIANFTVYHIRLTSHVVRASTFPGNHYNYIFKVSSKGRGTNSAAAIPYVAERICEGVPYVRSH